MLCIKLTKRFQREKLCGNYLLTKKSGVAAGFIFLHGVLGTRPCS